MVDDFQGNFIAEAGMDDRGGDVGRQTQAGLLASSFHGAGECNVGNWLNFGEEAPAQLQ